MPEHNYAEKTNSKASDKSRIFDEFSLSIAEKMTVSLKEFKGQQNLSSFTLLTAVFSMLLHRYTGNNRLVLGFRQSNGRVSRGFDVDFAADPMVDVILRQIEDKARTSPHRTELLRIMNQEEYEYIFPDRFMQPSPGFSGDIAFSYRKSDLSIFYTGGVFKISIQNLQPILKLSCCK
jgi:hypothetical protein